VIGEKCLTKSWIPGTVKIHRFSWEGNVYKADGAGVARRYPDHGGQNHCHAAGPQAGAPSDIFSSVVFNTGIVSVMTQKLASRIFFSGLARRPVTAVVSCNQVGGIVFDTISPPPPPLVEPVQMAMYYTAAQCTCIKPELCRLKIR
jgi:hypothetical protein